MRSKILFAAAAFAFPSLLSFSQKPIRVDLHTAVTKGNIEVYNRTLSHLYDEGYKGIRLSKDHGEGLAWIKGVEFSIGTIEFDVRGEDVKQHSFVGIAFHGANDSTFDAIYLRPFRFRETADSLRNRSVQYISLPQYTWRALRKSAPGENEAGIDPAPDPNAWVHMRVVVEDEAISVFVNGGREPSLVVKKVTALHSGRIGFYVADTSGGDFANLVITHTKQ